MSTSVSAEAIKATRDFSWNDFYKTSILRYAVGITASAAIAFALRWPLFYLAPMFAAFFLAQPAPAYPILETSRLLVALLVAFILGFVFSHLLVSYPLVYITLLGLTLFHIYYWVNRGGASMLALLPLAALMILPMISVNQVSLSHGFILNLYFVVSASLAIFTFLIAHVMMPNPKRERSEPLTKPLPLNSSRNAAIGALKSTLVVLPAAVLFLSMNWVSELLVIVFVAILSLSSEAGHGRAHGMKLLVANLIGGGVTLAFYLLIVAVPEYEFFITLMFLTMLAFGTNIFSQSPLAKFMPPASIALLVLIGASMSEHAHFIDKPFMRVVLISLAALYVVVGIGLLNRIFADSEYRH